MADNSIYVTPPDPWNLSGNTYKPESPERQFIDPRELQGLWIPADYLYAEDLSLTEKYLMGYLRMMDQSRHIFANNTYLSSLMGVKEQSIRNLLSGLTKKGYLETIARNPRVMRTLR